VISAVSVPDRRTVLRSGLAPEAGHVDLGGHQMTVTHTDGFPVAPARAGALLIFANTTTMYHPMHIHGHTFQLGPAGPRKDTVIVRPGQQVACDFDAANPGQWMTHCHNLYHAPQGGVMAMFSYQT
jgi:FtsP/CotA-like multicopper oxidase with cupredoxin domain